MKSTDRTAVTKLIRAALERDWREAYVISSRVLGLSDDPDAVFQQAYAGLPGDDADTLLEIARDAAGDLITDDSEGEGEGFHIVETGYSLFAMPVMIRAGFKPLQADFDLLARCLQDATDGHTVHIVPEVVSPEDFLSATPDAIRHCASMIDWVRTFDKEGDALEFIVDRTTSRPASEQPRMLAVLMGARVEHFEGGTDFIPTNWVNQQNDAFYERLRFLLKDRKSGFDTAEWPMGAGQMMPGIKLRLRMEEVVNEIATVFQDLGVMPDVLLFEDEDRTYVSLSLEGLQIKDVVVDRRGTTINSGDMAGMLSTFAPSVTQTSDPKVYSQRLRQGAALN